MTLSLQKAGAYRQNFRYKSPPLHLKKDGIIYINLQIKLRAFFNHYATVKYETKFCDVRYQPLRPLAFGHKIYCLQNRG